ncbi:MAG: hypothetical protein NTV86_07385, partial [Planctomycetota bacterium]|nr:hypothetical protein [Planctomycetota bacterium]
MNTRWILAAAVLAVVSVGLLVAADAPATKPVAIATVGSVEIMTEQVEQIVARQQVPADAVSDG